MTLDTLTGKRVALVGFGVENRALGQLLRAHDMPFAVCDARPADSDGDGLYDLLEAEHGTDPQNPDSDGDLYPGRLGGKIWIESHWL